MLLRFLSIINRGDADDADSEEIDADKNKKCIDKSAYIYSSKQNILVDTRRFSRDKACHVCC
jgi:hypothetical protein